MNTPKSLIFVVEDDAFLLSMITDQLSDNDLYSVKGFSNAEDCIEKLNENPALIILDYYLNKENSDAMDGLQAFSIIQKQLPQTKVIMLSGQDEFAIVDTLLNAGVHDYIIKDEDALRILSKKITKALLNS